jgi:hypothetical protein
LINHKNLREFFLSAWEDLKVQRSQMKSVKVEKNVEGTGIACSQIGIEGTGGSR